MTEIKESNILNITCGKNVTIIKPVNLYDCHLEDNVFIGPFVEIQRGAKIGAFTKIQSHSFICELVEIGKKCFIGHGVMFINDKFKNGGPANGNKDLWEKTILSDNVSIGSNSTILPINICSNTTIGAGSVVTKNIEIPGLYFGNPAKLIRKY
tara:strand:+ start:1579 stop:2037 length:459 start_codon:yes stop_codon:yes gene_type:complete